MLFGHPVHMSDAFPPLGDVVMVDPMIRLDALTFRPAKPAPASKRGGLVVPTEIARALFNNVAREPAPHLVPVRLGGPHEECVAKDAWSLWRGGVHQSWQGRNNGTRDPGFREKNGQWEYWDRYQKAWGSLFTVQPNDELRPPLGWTGDLPEGTRLATDFVVGQRVRGTDMYTCKGRTGVVKDEDWQDRKLILVAWDKGTDGAYSPTDLEGY